jgi:DNA-binding CsgD family transcriptional regulator
VLVGRDSERRLIEALLTDARRGRSGVLVVRGEAGIGKTALLQEAVATSGVKVLRCTGVEAERELPFAGLHQLLRPCLTLVERLPAPQASALRGAFGLSEERVADQLLVSLATLSLLAEAAAEEPLLCVVDDAQWLDPASSAAVLFAARRFDAEAIALLVGVRHPAVETLDARGLPELFLEPLSEPAARALLAARLADQALGRDVELLVRQAGGNPLALLELTARGHGPLEASFATRIAALPERTRLVLLLLAAGTDETVARALDRFGVALADAEPAAADGLVQLHHGRFLFRHPLVRSVAYSAAAERDRLRAHRALADAAVDELERAWHLSSATSGTSDEVAAVMEAAGAVSSSRAAFGSAIDAYARSAALSPDGADAARRGRLAAEAAVDAGRLERAVDHAAAALAVCDDPLEKARLWAVQANVENAQGTPDAAYELFMRAAQASGDADPRYASVMIVSGVGSALFGGWPERAFGPALALARTLPAAASAEQTFVREFLEGVCALAAGDAPEGRRRLERAVALDEEFGDAHFLTRVGLACVYLGDVPRAMQCYRRAAATARGSGSLAALPLALLAAAQVDLSLRSFAAAESGASEGLELTQQLGHHNFETCFIGLASRVAAYRGRVEECRELAGEALRRALAHNVGMGVADARLALAELELALGAGAAAREQLDQLPQEILRLSVTPDLVEAAVLEGAPELAEAAVAAFTTWSGQAGDRYLTALATRCRAQLLGSDVEAEPLHRQALELMTGRAPAFERARTELAYGEYLRRAQRRTDARVHLQSALATFEGLNLPLREARARAELEATGITARKRDPSTLDELTPQELRIARLVGAGASNRDVAAQLFLSPKTVEYHLRKVFLKLGVSSRVELARLELGATPAPSDQVSD